MPHKPKRDNDIELWIKTRRDAHDSVDDESKWAHQALDMLFNEYREWADGGVTVKDAMEHELNPSPECNICHRKRTLHGWDAYDYNPMQVVMNNPLGWYSGNDGEICPECMTKMIRNQ